MRNAIITGRAWSAYEELGRWYDTKARQEAEALKVRESHPRARVVFAEDDPYVSLKERERRLLHDGTVDEGYPDHAARVHSFAAEVEAQHVYYTGHARTSEFAQRNADAAAAWRAVRRTRDLKELEGRIVIAMRASAKVCPRTLDIIKLTR